MKLFAAFIFGFWQFATAEVKRCLSGVVADCQSCLFAFEYQIRQYQLQDAGRTFAVQSPIDARFMNLTATSVVILQLTSEMCLQPVRKSFISIRHNQNGQETRTPFEKSNVPFTIDKPSGVGEVGFCCMNLIQRIFEFVVACSAARPSIFDTYTTIEAGLRSLEAWPAELATGPNWLFTDRAPAVIRTHPYIVHHGGLPMVVAT